MNLLLVHRSAWTHFPCFFDIPLKKEISLKERFGTLHSYSQHYLPLAYSIELHCKLKQLKKEKYISEKQQKEVLSFDWVQAESKNVSQLDDCTTKRRFYNSCWKYSSDSLNINNKSQNSGYLLKKE